MTAWGRNWLEPNRLAVRLLLVALMVASLIIALGETVLTMGSARGARARPSVAPLGRRGAGDPRRRHAPLTLLARIAASTAVLVAVAVEDTVGTT